MRVSRKLSTKKKVVKSKKSAKPKGNFKKQVLKVIHDQAEDKMAYYTNNSTALEMFNSGISFSSDLKQVLPTISQGDGDNARTADQIHAKRLSIRGHIKLNPKQQAGAVSNEPKISNVVARLMVLSNKVANNYDLAVNQSNMVANSLLKKGGTTVGFTGILSDINAPINTDLFTVHHDKVFYLTQDYVFTPSSSAPFENSAVAIDIKNTVKFFNINLKCKNKLLKYDSSASGSLLPTNYGPFLVLGYAYLDGTTPDVAATNLGMQYISTLTYEDL